MSKGKANIRILKTYDQVQGLTAILNFNKQSTIEDNIRVMTDALKLIKTFSITKATRQIIASKEKVKKGNYISITDNTIICNGNNIEKVVADSIYNMLNSAQLVTLYFGKDIDKDKAENLKTSLAKKFSCEFQLYDGGQPHYYYIVSIE
jgi:hypothetical protein